MTPFQSNLRLVCYVALAMIAAASTSMMSIDFSDARQVALFTLGVLGSGFTALRSYIDTSSVKIVK